MTTGVCSFVYSHLVDIPRDGAQVITDRADEKSEWSMSEVK